MATLKDSWWVLITLLLINLIVTSLLAAALITGTFTEDREAVDPTIPCVTLPTQFIHTQPNCTNRLLRALNITSIRIDEQPAIDSSRNG